MPIEIKQREKHPDLKEIIERYNAAYEMQRMIDNEILKEIREEANSDGDGID
jgi:hypothetical protein